MRDDDSESVFEAVSRWTIQRTLGVEARVTVVEVLEEVSCPTHGVSAGTQVFVALLSPDGHGAIYAVDHYCGIRPEQLELMYHANEAEWRKLLKVLIWSCIEFMSDADARTMALHTRALLPTSELWKLPIEIEMKGLL